MMCEITIVLKHQQQSDGGRAAELVPAERQRDERAEQRRNEGRDRRDLEAQLHRLHERGILKRLLPGVERERLPHEVEFAGRLVEAVQHRDEDGQE
jgi:hypothetical protein